MLIKLNSQQINLYAHVYIFLKFRVTSILFLSSVLGETICIRYWEKCELVVDYAFVEKVQGSRKL